MVNELQSQNWDYLLDPAFQLVNTKGSPLTGGHLEVFYNGTRTPYYCASDFNGTLHPFKIPLDSLGSNVVLADPNFSYDVYVYNRFGVLQMSRYNVHPGLGGSGGGTSSEGGDAAHWIGKSGATVSVPKTIATTLPLPSNPDYEGDFATILNNTFTLAPGLYMVDCLVDFRQSSSDLTNKMGSIKFYTSDSSDPIEGQIFERNETGPDASGDSHQVQISFVRHVDEVDDDDALRFEMASSNDLTYAKIDRLSIVKLEQGGGGTAYTAGYGIDITGQVISTSGMMPESSAANFVNVDTYNTDIENIYETIAETSAMIPSGVATEQYVQDFTSAFITEDALDGYATQDWVVEQGYITSADIPDIPEDVITSGELATVSGDIVSQIPSLDGYATQDWVVDQGYLTSADLPQSVPLVAGEGISIVDTSASTIISIDSAYSPGVSEEWVEEYVSDATSAFITSADIPDVPEDLVTSAELATVSGDIVNQIPDVSDMATQTWVNEQGFLTSLPEDVVTSGQLATVSGEIMSQMPTQTTVSIDPTLSSGTKIAEYTINGVSGELFAPSGSSESIEYPLVYSASDFNDPMTSAYAEDSWDKYYTTVTPHGLSAISIRKSDNSLSALGLATDYLNFVADGEDYTVSPTEIVHWNDTYNAVDTSAAYWNSAYNAINASASNWNDAAGMNEYPISAGPGMSIEDVSGVTVFKTSGTMMDDLIEYNSQDEISGYNGHPVMTVDSEKQWLTHDDTIAHVTNSAQYAFGVNVPVVAQAMGTDETVLWTGNNVQPSSTAIVVSEALSNFNSVKFYWTSGNGMSEPVDELQVDSSGADLHFVHCTGGTNMWLQTLRLGISGTSITLQWAKNLNFGSGTSTTWSNPTITTTVGDSFQLTKIVGIGRKEN